MAVSHEDFDYTKERTYRTHIERTPDGSWRYDVLDEKDRVILSGYIDDQYTSAEKVVQTVTEMVIAQNSGINKAKTHYDAIQKYFTPEMLSRAVSFEFDYFECPVPEEMCQQVGGCNAAFLAWLHALDTDDTEA